MSRSPSRSRSRSSSSDRTENNGRRNGRGRGEQRNDDNEPRNFDTEMEYVKKDAICIPVSDQDIAFVLGTNGKTKRKIARVTGANLTIDEKKLVIEITGTDEQKQKAQEFVKLVMSQRGGSVYLDLDVKRDDLTIVDVPRDAVGFVTGRRGAVLRSVEEEWNTMMFFVTHKTGGASAVSENGDGNDQSDRVLEKLAIFGSTRGRIGSCLKVLSSIEYKVPNHVLSDDGSLKIDIDLFRDGFSDNLGVERQRLVGEDFSYALGNQGTTRKKIAKASNCILEYIRDVAYLVGTEQERQRCKDYLAWLITQRKGVVKVDPETRDDASFVEVAQEYVGYITGARGATLRRIEMDTDTFCFSAGDRNDRTQEKGRILIFSHSAENRKRAIRMIMSKRDEKIRMDTRGGSSFGRDRDGRRPRSDRNWRDRSRDRSRRDRRGRSAPRRSRSPRRRRRSNSRRRNRRDGRQSSRR